MKLLQTLALLTASGVLLSACASKPSIVPMATIPKPVPLECRIPCLQPPPATAPREYFEAAIVKWGMDCAAWHQDCADGLGK